MQNHAKTADFYAFSNLCKTAQKKRLTCGFPASQAPVNVVEARRIEYRDTRL